MAVQSQKVHTAMKYPVVVQPDYEEGSKEYGS